MKTYSTIIEKKISAYGGNSEPNTEAAYVTIVQRDDVYKMEFRSVDIGQEFNRQQLRCLRACIDKLLPKPKPRRKKKS